MSAGSALLNAREILAAIGVMPGAYVVDLGSGRTGHFAFSAGEVVGEEGRVYAVDIHPDVIETLAGLRALRTATNVHPLWGDIEADGGVPLPEGSADVVLIVHGMSSIADPEAAGREAVRLTRPGGKIVVIDWHGDADHPLAGLTARPAPVEDVDRMFVRLGCDVCGAFRPSNAHWGRLYRPLGDS